MIRYILKKCKNIKQAIYNRWFAYPLIEETLDEDDLAAHMADHNTPFSQGTIKGIITDMVKCIHELLLEGKNVKINNLAIFSIGIKNSKGGAATEEDFSVQKNIQGVKLRARATGIMLAKGLKLNASLKKATAITGSATSSSSTVTDPDPDGVTDGITDGTGTNDGGSTNNGGNGGTTPITPVDNGGGNNGSSSGGSGTGGNTGGDDGGGSDEPTED
jgi:nucleoid DNA-binding protein